MRSENTQQKDFMSILELAKKCGLYATDNAYKLYKKELEAFAAAIAKQAVKEYKASLVLVAWRLTHHDGSYEIVTRESWQKVRAITPLYVLGETQWTQ